MTGQRGGGENRTLERRTVLQSVGAATALGVGAGALGAQTEPNSDQPPSVRGSTEQVVVTDAVAGATVTLYDSTGTMVAEATADEFGSSVFREVEPAEGYVVSQTVDGAESPQSEPVTVLAVDYTPPQSHYGDQTLEEGFGYMEMRDGTTLAYQAQFPSGDPPYPVVVMYSGYAPSVNLLLPPDIATSLGYAIVGVNKRGTQCSGGKFDLWERIQWLDGYDMVEAIGAQDWADGIGLVGASYSGYSQFYVAAEQPPSLDAIAPGLPVGDFYRGVGYPGGMLNSTFAAGWAQGRDDETKPYTDDPGMGDVDERVQTDPVCDENQQLRHQNKPTRGRLVDTEFATDFYESRSPWSFVENVEVPTLLNVAWQDEQVGSRSTRLLERFAEETTVRFVGMNGDHESYLALISDLVEFMTFYVKGENPAGDDRSYEEALADYEASDPITIRWEANQSKSTRFETTHAEWPPGETWELYCRADGSLADSPPAAGEGATAEEGTASEHSPGGAGDAGPSENADVDPAQTVTSSYEYTAPTTDQQQISRDDQDRLVWESQNPSEYVAFVSDPLPVDHVCVGSGLADLWLASAAADTDLQVTLSEVRPDGNEMYVQDGWLRASHRAENPEESLPRRPFHTHLPEDQEPLPEEGFANLRVELFPFGHVFRAGSRVKVTVENPGGNRDLWAFDLLEDTATNEIASTPEMPSKVELPLVPDDDDLAEIPDRPDCGTVRNQPCRPVETSLLDLAPVGTERPKDPDGDGLYRDVRGDGSVDIYDVQTLFGNLDSDAIQHNAWAFNFDGESPGEVTVFDVQALFETLESPGGAADG